MAIGPLDANIGMEVVDGSIFVGFCYFIQFFAQVLVQSFCHLAPIAIGLGIAIDKLHKEEKDWMFVAGELIDPDYEPALFYFLVYYLQIFHYMLHLDDEAIFNLSLISIRQYLYGITHLHVH